MKYQGNFFYIISTKSIKINFSYLEIKRVICCFIKLFVNIYVTLQADIESAAGAGNAGRGKDIENILQAEKQEVMEQDEEDEPMDIDDDSSSAVKPITDTKETNKDAFKDDAIDNNDTIKDDNKALTEDSINGTTSTSTAAAEKKEPTQDLEAGVDNVKTEETKEESEDKKEIATTTTTTMAATSPPADGGDDDDEEDVAPKRKKKKAVLKDSDEEEDRYEVLIFIYNIMDAKRWCVA